MITIICTFVISVIVAGLGLYLATYNYGRSNPMVSIIFFLLAIVGSFEAGYTVGGFIKYIIEH